MSAAVDLEQLLLLAAAAFLPALVYLSWVRSTERGPREGWGSVLGAFVFGAFFATIVAGILEAVLVAGGTSFEHAVPAPDFVFLNGNTTAGALFLALAIAPFVEEGLKASGVAYYGSRIRAVADGPVIGASVGLGFGFFETFLYGLAGALTGGLVAGLFLILLRSVSSVVLHGSSTALFGYGYAESRLSGRGHGGTSHYFAAVGLHSAFNAVVSLGIFAQLFGLPSGLADLFALGGIGLGILLAFAAIEYVRRIIIQASYPGALASHPRYRPPPVRSVPRPPRGPSR